MDVNLAVFLPFIFVMLFTPGPNNLSSASMGVIHGYRATFKYLIGILAGSFILMLACGLASTTLLRVFPSFEPVLRLVGAAYILWLAFGILRASYTFDEDSNQVAVGFTKGFLLSITNPKGVIFGLTLYSTFLASISRNPFYLVVSVLLLVLGAFCSISIWALFGSAIRTYFHQSGVRRIVNLVFSLMLVYTAIDISGLVSLIL